MEAYAVVKQDERGVEVVGLRENKATAVRLALAQVSEYGYGSPEAQAEAQRFLTEDGSWTDETGALTVTVSHHWVR